MNQPDVCQVCKKPFVQGDDIVICPSCGAPYHRECYKKEGHCVYDAKHAQGFEYHPAGASKPPSPPPTAQNSPAPGAQAGPAQRAQTGFTPPHVGGGSAQGGGGVLCQNCRTINDNQNIFCERCGYPLHSPRQTGQSWQPGRGQQAPPPGAFPGGQGMAYAPVPDMQGEFDGIAKRDWAAYIGPSVPVYFGRMAQQDRRGSKISFTISAFFFPYFYFAYRKMWFWAAIAVLSQMVLYAPAFLWMLMDSGVLSLPSLSADTMFTAQSVAYYILIGRNLFFGLFALSFYRRDAAKKITLLKQNIQDESAYQLALVKKGGVSVWGVVAAGAILFIAATLVVAYGGEGLMSYVMSNYYPLGDYAQSSSSRP